MSRLLRFVTTILIFTLPLFAQTTASGLILSDTIWTQLSSPVLVTSTVTVSNGVKLTIEPGTLVKFDSAAGLVIGGTIEANGVTFTSSRMAAASVAPLKPTQDYFRISSAAAAPGDWVGIEFLNSASITSIFQNCTVQFAGGGINASAVYYKTGAPNIPIIGCVVSNNLGNGINVNASSPLIRKTILESNNGYAIFSSLLTNFQLDSCTLNYNTNGIRIPTSSSPLITNTSVTNHAGIGILLDNGASPTIKNNSIQQNGIGIQFTAAGAQPAVIRHNQIVLNTQWGFLNTGTSLVTADSNYWGSNLGPYNASTNPTGKGNSVSNFVTFVPWTSQAPAMPVRMYSAATTISSPTVWRDSVYWIKGNLTLSSTLTIMPGTVVKFGSGLWMIVNSSGNIIANGTPDSLIVFTSEKDDAYGGNTDGAGGLPAAGNWSRLELNGAGSNSSVLRYCLFRYGGSGTVGNLRIESCSPVIANIYSTTSSTQGIYTNNAAVLLDSLTVSGNGTHGIDITNGTVAIRNSIIQGNNSRGVFADGSAMLSVSLCKVLNNASYGFEINGSTATLQILDSSVVSYNNATGVYQNNGNVAQRFAYNKVTNNNGSGFWIDNDVDTVLFLADSIMNNVQEGIVTSKANVMGNVISANRYPVALIGRVGTKYSGNTITGNTFNNAIGLRLNGAEFSDTLRANTPVGSGTTYVLIDNPAGLGVAAGTTFVIQPGVIIKMSSGLYMNIDGTLIADGTPSQPIVFTSFRDSVYGGKTIAANDFTAPAPGNWNYIQFYNTSSNSVLNNCIFKYGGNGGSGMIFTNSVTFADTLTNLTFSRSSSEGLQLYQTNAILSNVRSDSNGAHGVYLYGSSPGSDVRVLNGTFRRNTGSGLYADDNSAFREVSNCVITNNGTNGITTDFGQITQYYYGNTIRFNGNNGLQLWNPNFSANDIQIVGNTISDNGKNGVVSTATRFIDNTLERNTYAIGVWGKLGNEYLGTNVVAQNTFNNAVAIVGDIRGTLASLSSVPILPKAYHVIDYIDVNTSDTLIIQPGTVIKFYKTTSNFNFTVMGKIFAEGTAASPIIFTSWRDSTAGGKTTAAGDTLPPTPGQWGQFGFYYVSSNQSVARHCEFRYGGGSTSGSVYFYDVSSILFANNRIAYSSSNGIAMAYANVTVDSSVSEFNNQSGVLVQNYVENNFQTRYSRYSNNGRHGIEKDASAKISLIDHCLLLNNQLSGMEVISNPVPLIVSHSAMSNNGDHGAHVTSVSVAADTALMFLNTAVKNNGKVGILSSRAYLISDSIAGNQYGIGVTGELSRNGTGNALGNHYNGNVIINNQRGSTIAVEGTIAGVIGGSYPAGFTSKVFAVRSNINVTNGSTLEVKPGAIFKFAPEGGDGYIQVNGRLLAVGEENTKIVFTSWKDDLYGGDTNNDTSATMPAPGDWYLLNLVGTGSDSSHLKNVIIRYGGKYSYANLYLDHSAATVESCYVSYSQESGIYMYYSSGTVVACDIHHNDFGIYAYGTSTPVVNYNNIYLNTTGLYAYSTDNLIDAKNNYWGAASGPLKTAGATQNLTGQGNKIQISGTGDVDFIPYLTARQGILYGDVSGNGQIAAYDASLVLQYVVSAITLNTVQRLAANVSGDTTISAFDASFILRYVVGLISGFPGLGKTAMETDALSAFDFTIERGKNNGEFDLVIRLNRPVNVYGVNFSLRFDTTLVLPLAMQRGEASDSMTLFHHFPKGKANVALAGTRPLTTKGDIARFTFTLLDAARRTETMTFVVDKFVINETDVTRDVGGIVLTVKDLFDVPTTFGLDQNFPNPFNPVTTINYRVPQTSVVRLTIYNMLGQEVRRLVAAEQTPGYYSLQWNGTDDDGRGVASGVYIYRIEATSHGKHQFVNVKKMLFVK